MRLAYALALGCGLAMTIAPALAKSPLLGCDAFLDKLRTEGGDLGVDFTHALVVSRARIGTNVFDITTKSDVDGTLTCKGDSLERFEAHILEPATARALGGFDKLQAAALRAALGWGPAKSKALPKSMAADAKEFFTASRQRGDVYIAGKTEEHAPGGISLGMIFTEVDRAFIIVAPEE